MATVGHLPPLARTWPRAGAAGLLAALVAAAALIGSTPADAAPSLAPAATPTKLVGTLQLTPGSCSGGKISGTYLRLILPSGGNNGPYLSNNDSSCPDQSYTPLNPGTDGGLKLGSYQPTPNPRFGPNGDARAKRITAPAGFYGTGFATATNSFDPQTKKSVPPPSATVNGTTLTADLRSFAVTWNNQDFNQGAPKPNGSTPGITPAKATGTYNAATGAYTLNWSSQVEGGPFDKFSGFWHFEGKFVPAPGSKPPSQPAANPGSGGGSTTSGSNGGVVVPGTAASPGAPGSAGTANPGTVKPGTAAAPGTIPGASPVLTADAAAAAQPTQTIVVKDRWKVSTPVIALAAGIAVLGFLALIGLSRLGRKTEAS